MLAAPDRWRSEAVVKVTHAGLRDAVQLPHEKDRYSLAELLGHPGLRAAVERLEAKEREDREARLDPVEQEILTLWDTLGLMSGIASGEALRVVPHPPIPLAPGSPWRTFARCRRAPPRIGRGHSPRPWSPPTRRAIARASRSAAAALGRKLQEMAPSGYPAAADLRREVRYNQLKPFRWAWVAYLFGLPAVAHEPRARRQDRNASRASGSSARASC